MWWKRTIDLRGAIYFRGGLSPSLPGLTGLSRANLEVEPLTPAGDEVWAANLRHPELGRARLSAPRNTQPPPDVVVKTASGLTEGEREAILRDAQSALYLEMPSQTGDVLRDRKQFLRFFAAALGDDGVTALDLTGQTFWTSGRLADELRHDAPLDIIHIHVLHLVTESGVVWLHSHGLAEIGLVDFDVLRPAEELTSNQFDVLRSIAFLIAEGASSGPIEPVVGADPILLVDAKSFMRSASAADQALRDPEGHTDRRVVCCDSGSGLIRRLFGGQQTRPSRLLSNGIVEGKHLIRFSNLSTDLTAVRARESLRLLEPFRAEFEDMKCTALVKLGYPTDSGREGREHLWFEVHNLGSDTIDATLVNTPFDIAKLKAGDRATHPVELVSDWAIVTPLGQLTPRSLELARKLRELRPRILEILKSSE